MSDGNYFNGLYYNVQGNGTPIIFLHGIGGSSAMFKPQVEELSKHYQTVTVDLKGNGKSASVATLNYLKVHIDSILDLMEYLHIKKATFVGLSYGGIVTQVFATKYPEKVKEMILIDTYAQTFPKDKEELKLTLLGACVVLASWVPKRLLKRTLSYIAPYKKWDLAQQELISITESCRARDVTLQMIEVFNINLLDDLNQIDIPVLVIVGDQVPSIVNKSKEIAQHLTKGQLLVVNNSVDPTNLCQPTIVNKAILNFTKEKTAIQM
ncbi:alpha/beta hydrolase [Bacillus sp. ISL-75]|uniref:alpha/beta fold hydrolase n=1 Tax=Bacillus sp. ISL-75 TaxID=2819137 RepID=UPI001BEA70AF|nr:alpha/beta hydrolase [Bacillus sp. ISL-75]MBT2729510.1 alpha/beta hydrolase [Bacillus sp. ISL-75]